MALSDKRGSGNGGDGTNSGAAMDEHNFASYETDEPDSVAEINADKYRARIARCPPQCLRYAYGGSPLWSGDEPRAYKAAHIEPCACGAARVFEMQLMPQLLFELAVDKHAGQGNSDVQAQTRGMGMDWDAVLVYSCPHSCGQSTEEFALVL